MLQHKLSARQRELLEMLAEEANELGQAKSKTVRHGPQSYHPADPTQASNWQLLTQEFWQLLAVARQLGLPMPSQAELDAIWRRKLKYTRHQPGSALPPL